MQVQKKKQDLVVGQDLKIPRLNDSPTSYINLDNAATTPPLKSVKDRIRKFMPYYSSVGRGAGYKSRFTTRNVEKAREMISRFVNGSQLQRTTIFTKHTTEGINKVANRLTVDEDDVILTTLMEHHANMLPWRRLCRSTGASLVYGGVDADTGELDLEDLFGKIERSGENLSLVALSGASNVTGYLPPLKEIAKHVHDQGAYLLVDGAQLIPHRKIDMGEPGEPGSIDFLAFSGHKMYAPFGAGVLIGPEKVFSQGIPDQQGGGIVNLVAPEFILWKSPPAKEEAGTPNALGIIALATAAKFLSKYNMAKVSRQEEELSNYTLNRLEGIENLTLYGPGSGSNLDRLGIFTFEIQDIPSNLVSAVLGYEFGIATRSGCFCAHPYLLRLMDRGEEWLTKIKREVKNGRKADLQGGIRASLGIYNTKDNVDEFIGALKEIINDAEKFRSEFKKDPKSGDFVPTESEVDFPESISL